MACRGLTSSSLEVKRAAKLSRLVAALTVSRSCVTDALAAPPAFTRASGGGRARGLCVLSWRFFVLAAGATALSRSFQRIQTGSAPAAAPFFGLSRYKRLFMTTIFRLFEGRMCALLFKPLVCKVGGPTQTRAALALVRFGLARGRPVWPSLSGGRSCSRSTGFPRSAPSWRGALLVRIRGYWGSLSLCACLRAGFPRAGVGSCGCFVARGHPSRCSRCSCSFSRCVLVCRDLAPGACPLRSSGGRVGPLLLPKRFPGLRCSERRDAPRHILQLEPPDATDRIPRAGLRAMIPGSRREWVSWQMRLHTKFRVQKIPGRKIPAGERRPMSPPAKQG